MFDRILVPIDGSATSDKGLAQAISLAVATHGRIRLIHVVSDALAALGGEAAMVCSDEIYTAVTANGNRLLADAASLVEARRIPVDSVLCEPSAERLADQVEAASKSWGANLIVIGSHGRRGVHRLLLGSDAEQILRARNRAGAVGARHVQSLLMQIVYPDGSGAMLMDRRTRARRHLVRTRNLPGSPR